MITQCQPADVLAIGAHPDDVELGCGGTLAKMAAAGHRVGVVDLTAGEMGTRGDGPTRIKESLAAAETLGLTFRACLGMPDTRVEHSIDNEMKLVEVIRTVRPRLILISLNFDTHPDHMAGADLAWAAWYKAGFGKYDSHLPPFRPERVIRYTLGQDISPTFVVDISAHIETRRKAVACYASQFDTARFEGKTRLVSPHFQDALDTRLKYYGSRILKDYGEPFVMKEPAEIADPALLTDGHAVFRN